MKEDIIVFGRGKYYHVKKELIHKKYNIKGFFDSNAYDDNSQEEGKDVYSPKEWKTVLDGKKIMICVLHWFPLYEHLKELGVPEEQIIFGLNEEPYFNDNEELLHKWKCDMKSNKLGIVLQTQGFEFLIHSEDDYKRVLRVLYRREYALIDSIRKMSFEPSSRLWGSERGRCIDRVYIENFLEKNAKYIHGTCMELGDDTYIRRYGENVTKSIVLHVYGKGKNAIQGNFETGEGLEENSVDCLICTQAMTAIYDLRSSFENIYKMLKPGGCALFTVSGAGGSPVSMSDYNNWGVYWRFTDKSMQKLLEEAFEKDKIKVESFGNVKTEMAIQYGLCAEDLEEEDFDYYDEKYPLIITAVARK